MDKPGPIRQYPEAGYPTLEEFSCDRRQILKSLAKGVAVVGIAGPLLTACPAGAEAYPEYYTLRLPENGYSQTFIKENNYLSFALMLTTYSMDFADFCAVEADECIQALNETMGSFLCEEVTDPNQQEEVLSALEQALLALYDSKSTGQDPGITSMALDIEFCDDEGPLAGEEELPKRF